MRLILVVNVIVCCILLSHGETTDCQNKKTFIICQNSDIITSVSRDPQRYEKSLTLGDANGVASNAFKHLDIQELTIVRTEAYWKPRPPHKFSLHQDSLTGLRSLTKLKLSGVGLIFEGYPLIPLCSLDVLELEDVGLTDVPSDFFARSNLTKLYMKDNDLAVIRVNAFDPLENLELLSLQDNRIRILEPGCFDGLPKLSRLDLSYNKLMLTPGIFSSLKQLNHLDLTNGVKTFNPQAFRGLLNLKQLIIPKIDIVLEPGMFQDSLRLEDIHMRKSRFQHIPKNVFNHLTSLKFLTLSFNPLKSIEPGAFAGTRVANLNLEAGYDGQVIQPDVFSNLTATKFIFWWNNHLDIKPRAFDGLKTDYLALCGNNLGKIANGTFTGAEIGKLDLRSGVIHEFEPDAFRNATIGSIIVDLDGIFARDRSNWGIPDSIRIELYHYALREKINFPS